MQSSKEIRIYNVLARQKNLKSLKLSLLVLCFATPVFAAIDYFWGNPANLLNRVYATVDLALFAMAVSLLLLSQKKPTFTRKYHSLLLIFVGYTLVSSQVFMRAFTGSGPLYILLIEILGSSIIFFAPRNKMLLHLAIAIALALPLWFFGYPGPEIISPLLAAFFGGALVVFFKEKLLKQEAAIKLQNQQINASLKSTQRLKEEQDGDYFLTSLLTNPMSGNFALSDQVGIDIYINQKKKCTFRNRQVQVGGDLCTAHTITLKGEKYIAFVNADAMGKSMQGAGGALVFGTIFMTHVNRVQRSAALQKRSPEKWLRECILDLQHAFESFNGSMYMSCVLGLVAEESGLVYFVNSEHPGIVLYRDEKARFIEKPAILRKLGLGCDLSSFRVNTFQLRPGDCLVMGSDGRDDLRIPAQGRESLINHDETLFLNTVEESQAALNQMVDRMQHQGEITDDLSLLKISYLPVTSSSKMVSPPEMAALGQAQLCIENRKFAQAEQVLRKQPQLVLQNTLAANMLYKSLVGQGRYLDCAVHCHNFAEKNPGQLKYFRRASLAYKMAQVHQKTATLDIAIDLAERVRMRTPQDLNNLVNLADLYRLAGDTENARKILNLVIESGKSHRDAEKLQSLIANSQAKEQKYEMV